MPILLYNDKYIIIFSIGYIECELICDNINSVVGAEKRFTILIQ